MSTWCITLFFFFFNRLPVANLDPEEVFEEQDINNQTGDLYRYIAYVPYGDSIWQFESEKLYPIRRSRITPGVHWINTLQRWIAAEVGSHPFGTTFLAVSENPKVVVGEKYDAIHEFHGRIVDRLDTDTRFARNAGEVLTQLHLNRVRTSMISHLRNLVNTDLGDRAVEFLGQYGLGLEVEVFQASQAVRGRKTRGRPRSIRGTRRKVASQSTGRRGGCDGFQTGSRKRQRGTDCETEIQRKQRVKKIYGLRK
jgi:hypothetical protein